MNQAFCASVVLGCLLSVPAVADDTELDRSKPVELTAAQMDRLTAGGLLLPNGREVFVNLLLNNGEPHPALANSPVLGPWQAHFKSSVIDFIPPE
jgi:hypothetical protein